MRLEEGLIAFLDAQSPAITLYPFNLLQDTTYPAVTYTRISTSQPVLLAGVDTLTNVTIQVDVWADTLDAAKTLAYDIRNLLNGKQGDMGGVSIQYCRFNSENDLFELQGDWAKSRVSMDFEFTLHE